MYEYVAGCDETYSLNIRGNGRVLDMTPEEFMTSSAQLASLHFSAAQSLVPRLRASLSSPTYTFVTGNGSGKPGGDRTSMGEINSHHVWGLSAALRKEMSQEAAMHATDRSIMCRDLRVGLPVSETVEEDVAKSPTRRPMSEDIGDLCAGLMAAPIRNGDNGKLIQMEEYDQLEKLLAEYNVALDANVGSLPRYDCDQRKLSRSA